MARPLRLFLIYAPADALLKSQLEAHLAPLIRAGAIDVWHAGKIDPGQDRAVIGAQHQAAADAVLVLVSPDLLASKDCLSQELDRAMERHHSIPVVPIVARPVDWRISAIGCLEPLPQGGKPVTTWHNPDKAWLNIVRGLRKFLHISSDSLLIDGSRHPSKQTTGVILVSATHDINASTYEHKIDGDITWIRLSKSPR